MDLISIGIFFYPKAFKYKNEKTSTKKVIVEKTGSGN